MITVRFMMGNFFNAKPSIQGLLAKNKTIDRRNSGIFFDLVAFLIILSVFAIIAVAHTEVIGDISSLKSSAIDLDYHNLFSYSMRTILRMFIAIIISIIFSIIYATIAAKNQRMEQILVPLLDILQSVPILGYISFTVTFFLALFPGKIIGAECAAIFAIFTSQVWNITFSIYQSFKTVPKELQDAAKILRMTAWQKFWRVELPFAIPGIIWNKVVSMSGGWFFIVVSELIIVGDKTVALPGIGSYIALALDKKDVVAIIYAIIAMISVILIYNQLIINPLIAWAEKFHYENTSSYNHTTGSWLVSIFNKSKITNKIVSKIEFFAKKIIYIEKAFMSINPAIYYQTNITNTDQSIFLTKLKNYIWYGMLLCIVIIAGKYLFDFMSNEVGLIEVIYTFKLAIITWLRVIILVTLACMIWAPIGIYIGLHPKLCSYVQPIAQFCAAFPLNILFPLAVILITHYNANPNIWLSPLMIVGTQWYILFNVIAGSSAVPLELKEVAQSFRIKGWLWWKKIMIPSVIPYFITGAITASGGAWNASIVAEVVNFGDKKIVATGLGSYINEMTIKGDLPKVALGIGMMVLFIVVFDHIFWQPLYAWSRKKFQL